MLALVSSTMTMRVRCCFCQLQSGSTSALTSRANTIICKSKKPVPQLMPPAARAFLNKDAIPELQRADRLSSQMDAQHVERHDGQS